MRIPLKVVISLCVKLLLSNFAYSQDDDSFTFNSPPSPNATSLIREISTNVDLYSGIPRISLPIDALKSRFLDIPITMSYNGGGIKVQDVPSWVGTGWTIHTGGAITRIVRGLPDETANGFCGVNNIGEKAYLPPTEEYIRRIGQDWDGAPDIFFISLPNYSGKFFLDERGTAFLIPHANLKIRPAICNSGATGWIITDASGIEYYFGKNSDSQEITQSSVTGSTTTTSYVSSWYLSEIVSPNGIDKILFSYESDQAVSYKYFTQTGTARILQATFGYPLNCVEEDLVVKDINLLITINAPKYIKKISSSFGSIDFKRSEASREDLPGGKYLEEIQFKDYDENIIFRYNFNYSYFVSDDCSTDLCKRLKLLSITKKESSGNMSVPVFSFEYSSLNLPSRDSHQIDHWGYYNNNTHTSKLPTFNDMESGPVACGFGKLYPGADKSPDEAKSQANILTKIFNSSGGYAEYLYDAHEVLENGENKPVGGARVKTILYCSGDGNCHSVNYDYAKFDDNSLSSGEVPLLPKYYYRSQTTAYSAFCNCYTSTTVNLNVKSNSLAELFDFSGNHIGYSDVKVSSSQGGHTYYRFNGFTSHPDSEPDFFQFVINVNKDPNSIIISPYVSPDGPPYTPKTSRAHERGLLREKLVYDQNMKLLTKETFDYTVSPLIKQIASYNSMRMLLDGHKNLYYVGKQQLISNAITPEKTVTYLYDQTTPAGNLTNSSSISEYIYNASTLLPIQITSYSAHYPSMKRITKTKYVSDFPYYPHDAVNCQEQYNACMASAATEPDWQIRASLEQACSDMYNSSNCTDSPGAAPSGPETDAIQTMIENHQLTAPVEVQNLVNQNGEIKLVASTVYKYSKIGAYPNFYGVTKEIWNTNERLNYEAEEDQPYKPAYIDPADGSFRIDERMRKVHSHNSYDASTGNLLSETGVNGIPTAYEWSANYQQNYLTAVTSNPNTVSSGDFQHRRSLGYKPLVGPTSETDENNRSKYYEYDGLGTLLLEKNNNGHIKKRYRVNYINSDFAAQAFSVAGIWHPGNSLSFSFADTKRVGETKYVWDFGDGQVLEGASTPVYHSYSEPGTYTVKLANINPEYGSAIKSQIVTVYAAPSVTAFSDCSDVIICGSGSPPTCNLYASVSGGCENIFIEWQLRYPGGAWATYGTGAQLSFDIHAEGTYEFRCVVTENASECGLTAESNIVTINADYDPNCEQN